MNWHNVLTLFLISTFLLETSAQEKSAKRTYEAQQLLDEKMVIDGYLDEEGWSDSNVQWASQFIQRSPREGMDPGEQTEFSIQYDHQFVYIAFKCFDRSVELINSRMSRRDGYNGDWVEIIFDSYHDLRTAFSFSVSAAGVKGDKLISLNGSDEDPAWNPIWYTKSALTDFGWTAEMKIPLSQLRFGKNNEQIWGMQVQRRILRSEELSVWQRVPLDAPGWVSEFGELHGLQNLKPQRQLEIQPFVVGSYKTFELEPLNPYRDTYLSELNMGLDGKVGVTNDLTLDFTINPDFGQVEADPAALALDGFQLFFAEQRPFFVENKNIFDYRFSSPVIGSQYSSDNLFYSRRIGRTPQGSVTGENVKFINSPQRTAILGAVKFSGKTKKGLSIGVLESLTANEYADVRLSSSEERQLVEPLTNYSMARVQQDLNNRNTFLGGIITSVERNLTNETDFLHRSAKTAGLDFLHQWSERTWYVGTNLVASRVDGSQESILATQRAISHLFHREGARHLQVDSTSTRLLGHGGDVKFGKAGKGHLTFESGVTWRSPELELNDMGFMREADLIQNYLGVTYQSVNSFGSFRRASIQYKHWINWDYAWALNYIDWDVELNATHQKNWSGTFGFFSQPHNYAKSLLRGGPRLYLPAQYGFWWAWNSDNRKKLAISYHGWTKTGGEGSYYLLENGLEVIFQPADRLNISVHPTYTNIAHRLWYNDQFVHGGQNQYIVSYLDQETISLPIRIDLTLGANLTLQYFGEPFVTTGRYQDFASVSRAGSATIEQQLHAFTAEELQLGPDNLYRIDEDRDGLTEHTFVNPNFTFSQFRSNLVLRYEYVPGSELFVVWSQNASALGSSRRLYDEVKELILDPTAENTFLIKATYRFHR